MSQKFPQISPILCPTLYPCLYENTLYLWSVATVASLAHRLALFRLCLRSPNSSSTEGPNVVLILPRQPCLRTRKLVTYRGSCHVSDTYTHTWPRSTNTTGKAVGSHRQGLHLRCRKSLPISYLKGILLYSHMRKTHLLVQESIANYASRSTPDRLLS